MLPRVVLNTEACILCLSSSILPLAYGFNVNKIESCFMVMARVYLFGYVSVRRLALFPTG